MLTKPCLTHSGKLSTLATHIPQHLRCRKGGCTTGTIRGAGINVQMYNTADDIITTQDESFGMGILI